MGFLFELENESWSGAIRPSITFEIGLLTTHRSCKLHNANIFTTNIFNQCKYFSDDPVHHEEQGDGDWVPGAGGDQSRQDPGGQHGRLEVGAAVRASASADQPAWLPPHQDTIRRLCKFSVQQFWHRWSSFSLYSHCWKRLLALSCFDTLLKNCLKRVSRHRQEIGMLVSRHFQSGKGRPSTLGAFSKYCTKSFYIDVKIVKHQTLKFRPNIIIHHITRFLSPKIDPDNETF